MAAISVIIPAYNAAPTIGAALDSVLAQTFDDFEVIVVDDGSSDGTAGVVKAVDDARVTLVQGENAGVSTARNRGLERAGAPLVAFLDADDAWQPLKLERQEAAMSDRPHVGVCFGSAEMVDDELRPIGAEPAAVRSDYTEGLLLEGNIVAGGGSGVMARASVIDRAGGFDTRLSQCADWDMWLRLSVITGILPLPDTLIRYRVAAGSMSSDPALLERDTIALLDKFFADPESARYQRLRRRAYANQRMVCAGSYLHARLLRDSLRCVGAAVRDDPRVARRLASVPVRWTDRARRRTLQQPPSDRDAVRRPF